jgi:hypothetical protein
MSDGESAVSWRHLKYEPSQNGLDLIFDVGIAETIMLMNDLDISFRDC